MSKKLSLLALDIGTTKTCAALAVYHQPEQAWKILGMGLAGTEGIKKGRLVQPALAAQSIKLAVERAGSAAKTKAKNVLLGLPMSVCQSFWNRCSIPFYDERQVKKEDIAALLGKLSDIKLNKRYQLLKVLPHSYFLDNKKEVKAPPLGQEARELSVAGQLYYLDEPDVLHWQQLLKSLGFAEVYFGIALEALAQTTVPLPQRQMGVLLLDLGSGLVQIGLFEDNMLRSGSYIPVAGNHILADIMYGANVHAGEARRLLLEHGQAEGTCGKEDMLTIFGPAGEERSQISKEYFYRIINARVEEIFSLVKEKLTIWEREGLILPQLVYLGGGLSLLPGIKKSAEKCLGLKVELPEKKKSMVYQTAEGLFLSAKDAIAPELSAWQKTLRSTRNWWHEFF